MEGVLGEVAACALEEPQPEPCASQPNHQLPHRLYASLGVDLWITKLCASLLALAAGAACYASSHNQSKRIKILERLCALP